jgi:hypothetical protein
VSQSDKLGFIDSIFQFALQFDLKAPSPEQKTDEQIAKIVNMFPNTTTEMQLQATKILIEKLPVESVNFRVVLHLTLDRSSRLIIVEDFRFVWLAQLDRVRDSIEALKFVDVHPLCDFCLLKRQKSRNVLERTRILVFLHSCARDMEEKVMLWKVRVSDESGEGELGGTNPWCLPGVVGSTPERRSRSISSHRH